MSARTNTKGYGGLLLFDSLIEKADVPVYLSYTRMSDTQAGKRGGFPHSFVCSLRNAHFLFCSPDSLFGSLCDVLEERTSRLSGLSLVRRRRASVRVCCSEIIARSRFTM